MNKQVRYWVLTLLSFIPIVSFASLPSEPQIGMTRRAELQWADLLKRLVNNRMPQSYYDFLGQHGIYTYEQIMSLDESLKEHLMQMYKEDLVIMAGNDRTRSIW